ncbi:chitinase-3-like protein 2 [Ostrinia nubilalis]|uniref:chitinase-3-like protein 2 n=1 Tax=Ostrinia nubilalis TaxID=29057 RepID=UPI0030822512
MGFILLLVLSFCASEVLANNDKVVVCYYGTWATYRWGVGKFDVEDIDPFLCTHLVYSFIGIDAQGTAVSLDPHLDLGDVSWTRDNFRKFTSLKDKNPNLKTLLAVGGWNEASAKYSVMAANPNYRQNFIQSSLAMIQEHNFDGLDVDWEYPNRRDTVHGSADIDNFSTLLKELREEFDKHDLMVTVAVSAVEERALLSYDVPAVAKYVDYVGVMAYDMSGAWDPVTGHNAPLHISEGDSTENEAALYTVENAIKFWLKAGCPPEKLVMGVPFYGRTFTLSDTNANTPRSSAIGAGLAGPYTATSGFVGYNEFCYLLKTESWTVRTDQLAKVPYAFRASNWVSYDDVESITTKVEYANSFNLRGIMLWSIETDDFHGLCGEGTFPLLKAINKALSIDYVTSTPAPGTTVSYSSSASTSEASSSESSSSSSTITSTTTTTTSTPGGGSESSLCKEVGYIPDPTDCTSYYVCIEQIDNSLLPIKFQCPGRLYWDQNYLNCNYDYLVECNA